MSGFPKSFPASPESFLLPTNAIAQTMPRSMTANITAPSSGTLLLGGIVIPSGNRISNISFMSGNTAAVTPANQWFSLLDSNFNVLGKTVDDGATAWPSNTVKTLALSAPVTTGYTGLYYLGFLVVAGTVPSLVGMSGLLAATTGLAPVVAAVANTGLTNPASMPAQATGVAGTTRFGWGWVS